MTSSSEKERHSCDSCGKSYSLRNNMLRHQRTECGQEPRFACQLCSFKTKRKDSLECHMAFKHFMKKKIPP